MAETLNTPSNTLQEQGKITPDFDFEKFGIGADEIKAEVEQITKGNEAPPHSKVLQQLLEQIQPFDFEAKANPDNLEDFKLNAKHLLILSIENTLEYADKNLWGLCKNHDFIYLFNGMYWNEIDKEAFQKFLGEAAERMGVKWNPARHYQFREHLFKQFISTAYLPNPEYNNEKVLINLQNGTFEITNQGTHLRPFDRADFLTYQLPFDYNPEAKAPIFEAYLNRVLPDLESQRVLAEYLGYIFIKNGSKGLKLEKALVLYGSGANGKSVFAEVVHSLMGAENTSSFSLQSLTNENGYYRAKLANKLVNYATEISINLDNSHFKALASGEPVEARLPYGQPFVMKQYAKLIFNSNELPKDVEHSDAYFRRFLIIPFNVTIPEKEQDKQLHVKIIENELSGVFNWVLAGLNRLIEQRRFSNCEVAQRAVEQYRVESDSVQMFLTDQEYQASATMNTALKDLFKEYREYCNENGFRSGSLKTFSERLRKSGYETTRKAPGMFVNAEKISFF